MSSAGITKKTANGDAHARLREALRARVRNAAEAALAAFHAAEGDRRRLWSEERERPARDTLGDIERIADVLHGFASWTLTGAEHPDSASVRKQLRALDPVTRFDLRAKLLDHHPPLKQLSTYVGRIRDLYEAVSAYFAGPAVTSPRQVAEKRGRARRK
jgi:hypothetical protein